MWVLRNHLNLGTFLVWHEFSSCGLISLSPPLLMAARAKLRGERVIRCDDDGAKITLISRVAQEMVFGNVPHYSSVDIFLQIQAGVENNDVRMIRVTSNVFDRLHDEPREG